MSRERSWASSAHKRIEKPTSVQKRTTIKDLLMEIKFDRKLKRAALNGDGVDEEDIDLEDWDYRNFKDGWIPTFKRLRRKLVNYYKDKKFNKQSEEGPKAKLLTFHARQRYDREACCSTHSSRARTKTQHLRLWIPSRW